MHLSPSAEQQALKDAVRRFCVEQVTPERLAVWEREPSGVDAACWRMVAELGWFGLGVPPAAGGSGLGLVEIASVLEECARGLMPRRVINAIRGSVALARAAPESGHLHALARGESTVALAFDERAVRTPTLYQTRVAGAPPRLHGEKWYVADAVSADLHLVAACEGTGVSLVLARREAAPMAPLRTFDGERQAVVTYDGIVVERVGAASHAESALTLLQQEQVALALAEMVGGMDAVLAMTVAYVKEREQFGQKLAVFQAVQHQVADMATAFTAARHLAWQAITRFAVGTLQGAEIAVAAAFVGQAFKRLTLSAHHLHGGAGYVVEHPLHYHAERAQALCIRYAPEAVALEHIAARLLDGAVD